MTRVFRHPLARHPVVGPLLELLDAKRGDDAEVCLGRALEVRIARHRALQRFLRWATEHVLPPELEVVPDAVLEPLQERLPDALRAAPEAALARWRPSRSDAFAGPRALEIASHLVRVGPAPVRPGDTPALRRLARTGVWPDAAPTFIGRLDATAPADDYTATPALVRALAAGGRWTEATSTLERLRGAARVTATVDVFEARLRAGHEDDLGAFAARLQDRLRARAALVAQARGDGAGARSHWQAIVHPRHRHHAAARLARGALELEDGLGAAQAWLASIEPEASGEGLRARGLVRLAAKQRGAREDLLAAAIRKRACPTAWAEGRRPDRGLAEDLLVATLSSDSSLGWPWSASTSLRWLDDLDAMKRVVIRVGRRLAEDPEATARVTPERLRTRLAHAVEVVRIDGLDWANVTPAAATSIEARAFVRGLLVDEAFGRTLPREPTDPARAFYDDGLARSALAKSKRRVLVNASKQTLSAARRLPAEAAAGRAVVAAKVVVAAETRVATLAELGGGRAEQVLLGHLGRADGQPNLRHLAIAALSRIAGATAVSAFMQDALQFGNTPEDDTLRLTFESSALLPEGFTASARRLLARLRALGHREIERWWVGACAEIWRQGRLALAPVLFDALHELDAAHLEGGPDVALEALRRGHEALAGLSPAQWLAATTATPTHVMGYLLQSSLPHPGRAWSWPRWQGFLERLRARGTPDDGLALRWAAGLGLTGGRGATERMLAGRAPVAELDAPIALPGLQLRLRYLHKTESAFGFFRFADTVGCCFNSGTSDYSSVGAERSIQQLWLDPLSFCLTVETAAAPYRTRGFVFGGFGQLPDGATALLLNGLYLSRKAPDVRAALLEVIERHFARPLGVDLVGLGNQHGGRGPLPEPYRMQRRSVNRRRALRDPRGQLVRSTYDDLGTVVNTFAPAHLAWRKLS